MRALALGVLVGTAVLGCGQHAERVAARGTPVADAETGTDEVDGEAADATDYASREATGRDAALADAGDAPHADTSCLVLASSFDQSCTVDGDCMPVGQVLVCPVNPCADCLTGAIHTSASAAYNAAFSRATSALPRSGRACNCPNQGHPCCDAGTCGQCF